ncbi:hypothetical protein [Burkholderia cenocepacia]|nr:hypothetical protein [Burkholderia cenocepacia]MDR5645733.1 hypothetical protein [Burkholderia cenocepacia]
MSLAEIEHVRVCIRFDSGSMVLDGHDRYLVNQLIDSFMRQLPQF